MRSTSFGTTDSIVFTGAENRLGNNRILKTETELAEFSVSIIFPVIYNWL